MSYWWAKHIKKLEWGILECGPSRIRDMAFILPPMYPKKKKKTHVIEIQFFLGHFNFCLLQSSWSLGTSQESWTWSPKTSKQKLPLNGKKPWVEPGLFRGTQLLEGKGAIEHWGRTETSCMRIICCGTKTGRVSAVELCWSEVSAIRWRKALIQH